MPRATASAMAAASAWSAALSGRRAHRDPQLQVMMCGRRADGRVERTDRVREVDLDRPQVDIGRDGEDVGRLGGAMAVLVRRGVGRAGPSVTGVDAVAAAAKKGCAKWPQSTIATLMPRPVMPPRCARSALQPSETSCGTSRCQYALLGGMRLGGEEVPRRLDRHALDQVLERRAVGGDQTEARRVGDREESRGVDDPAALDGLQLMRHHLGLERLLVGCDRRGDIDRVRRDLQYLEARVLERLRRCVSRSASDMKFDTMSAPTAPSISNIDIPPIECGDACAKSSFGMVGRPAFVPALLVLARARTELFLAMRASLT